MAPDTSDTSRFLSCFRGKRALLVASTGGHLSQMIKLEPRLGVGADSAFVTFDLPQARSGLMGRQVEWVPYIAPRAYGDIVKALPEAVALIRRHRPEVVFSTGAGIAVPYLLAADLMGVRAVYLESVSRILGPSASGRLLARVPGVRTFTQHHHLQSPRWGAGVSTLDDFEVTESPLRALPARPRIFVTLGTIAPFRFDRLIDKVIALASPDWELTWQLGSSMRGDVPGTVRDQFTTGEFDDLVRHSDVVISHSGVGSAMRVMELGKTPVLVPREAAHREHVDNHQRQISAHLAQRGLCEHAPVELLSMEHLERAHRRAVVPAGSRYLQDEQVNPA